jgi:hypothetical protein
MTVDASSPDFRGTTGSGPRNPAFVARPAPIVEVTIFVTALEMRAGETR